MQTKRIQQMVQEAVYQLKWRFPDRVFTEHSLKQNINSVWTNKCLFLSCPRTGSCQHCSLLLEALRLPVTLTRVMQIWNTQFHCAYSHSSSTWIIIPVKKVPVATGPWISLLSFIYHVTEPKYTHTPQIFRRTFICKKQANCTLFLEVIYILTYS